LSFHGYAIGILLIGFSNVVLFNLIIAIMGDAYEEIMTSVAEKNLKHQNLMILKSEALNFRK